MASAFSHAIAAAAIGSAFYRRRLPARFWVLGAACSIVPDADVIGVVLGVPFRSVLGHRGLTHSLVFAAVLAAVVVLVFFARMHAEVSPARLWLYFFLATASHGVLDALTNGGPGIAFFAPFDNDRYFLPWRPVVVSPIGIRPFFSEWGLRVIESELAWIWLPSLICAGLVVVVRRRRDRVAP
ncbi:MAG TPA: metal-dependent hydrolase [Candidatus Acidoferrum sp.]|nr:metal-dependent hydrolase [Candidatus Acidoferrum sp.]